MHVQWHCWIGFIYLLSKSVDIPFFIANKMYVVVLFQADDKNRIFSSVIKHNKLLYINRYHSQNQNQDRSNW